MPIDRAATYSVKEAANRLGVDRTTLFRWMKKLDLT